MSKNIMGTFQKIENVKKIKQCFALSMLDMYIADKVFVVCRIGRYMILLECWSLERINQTFWNAVVFSGEQLWKISSRRDSRDIEKELGKEGNIVERRKEFKTKIEWVEDLAMSVE